MTQTQHRLTLERFFEASPERVFDAWLDRDAYAVWMNPGEPLIIHEWDPRVGGRCRMERPIPGGQTMEEEGTWFTIDRPNELLLGSVDRSFLLHVTFTAEGAGTRMRVVATGVPPEHHEGATVGWNACFDKLAGILEA